MKVSVLGRIPYRTAWEAQKELQQAVIAEKEEDTLLLCEHPPVITFGKSAKNHHLLASPEELTRLKVETLHIERGGDVTYHGPGQLVGYPILDLRKRKRDVDWYMRKLEEVLIQVMQRFTVEGTRIKGKTGVWVSPLPQCPHPRKIASLGVRISRWVTMHGFALNVGSVPEELSLEAGFALINPCGLGEVDMTSLGRELGLIGRASAAPSVPDLYPLVAQDFARVFAE